MTDVPLAAQATARPLRSDLALAAGVFSIVLGALIAAIVATALATAGPAALWADGRPVRLARFCGFLALVTAYLAGAVVLVIRGARQDFAELRHATDSTPERWSVWEQRFRSRRHGAIAAGVGAVLGLTTDAIGVHLGGPIDLHPWRGLVWWSAILNMLLFANLAVLARWSLLEIRSLRAIGRRVRVSLLDKSALAPFVRAGLRSSIVWLVGSSLATTLMLDVNAPWIVGVVLAGTMALAVAVLLFPSVGLNERLRTEKLRELAWVRGEIARAREALARSDAASRDEASRLPALLAWETRVDDASTWPFDTPTLLRFSLLLLVPIGSWSGGALIERVIDSLLG